MIEIKEQTQQRGGNQYSDAQLVDVNTALTTITATKFSKSFQSQGSKISGGSTMSSRTITWSNKSGSADTHSLNLTGVDSTTVVSPGCWSGPRINGFISHMDAHGVFSFYALNSLPTYSNLIEWICDSDSLVKEFDFWSMQDHINQIYRESSPANTNESSVPRISKKVLRDQNQSHHVNDHRGEDTASRTKNVNVIHGAILSQKNEATHV